MEGAISLGTEEWTTRCLSRLHEAIHTQAFSHTHLFGHQGVELLSFSRRLISGALPNTVVVSLFFSRSMNYMDKALVQALVRRSVGLGALPNFSFFFNFCQPQEDGKGSQNASYFSPPVAGKKEAHLSDPHQASF